MKDKKFLPFDTRAEADSWAAAMDTHFGYPDEGTQTYTEVFDHPSNGKSYALTSPKCYPHLSGLEIAKLNTRGEVDAVGLFPPMDWSEE